MDAGAEIPAKKLAHLYVGGWKWVLAQPGFIKSLLFAASARLTWAFGLFNRRAIKEALPGLRNYLDSFMPDVVVPTHWGCGHLFHAGRLEFGFTFPIAYLYTELASAYRQVVFPADRYFCLTAEARDALIGVGVVADTIRVVDLIVQPDLAAELPERGESRRRLGLLEDLFTVLFSLGGEGIGNTVSYLDHYFENGSQAQVLVLTGKNRTLLQVLTNRYQATEGKPRIIPVGYLPDLRTAFAAADVFAGKCGTSFAVESIKARRPLLINQVGAPNEAENRDYMVKHGFGIHTPRPADLTAQIETFAVNPASYQRALTPFAYVTGKSGAEDIVDYLVEELADRRKG